jgi:hypothetical protein
MANKDKIAICVSGQTRNFNENPQMTADFLEVLNLFSDYDYDLYGHTWADQEDPHKDVLDKFTEYRSDDQGIIWDAITKYNPATNEYFPLWTQFFYTKEEWYKKPEYMDMLEGRDSNYIDFAKDRIYGNVGQVWSAHECFLLLKPHIKNNYKFVVRLRWDSTIRSMHGHEYLKNKVNEFKDILYNWSYRKSEWGSSDKGEMLSKVNCLSANNCVISHKSVPYCNDHIFVFNAQMLYQNLIHISPIQLLSKLLHSNLYPDNNFPSLPSAHTLWMQWILVSGFIVSPILPNLTQTNSGPYDNKPNKEWGI